jgi:hypothetical protein
MEQFIYKEDEVVNGAAFQNPKQTAACILTCPDNKLASNFLCIPRRVPSDL